MESQPQETALMSAPALAPTLSAPVATPRRRGRSLLQAAIGAGALILVLARVDRSELARALAHVDPALLCLAALLNLFMTYLMAMRWRWFLMVKYPRVTSRSLFRHYLIGQFFNLFTPGAVGGDLARIIGVGKETGDRSFVFATIVVERMVGLCGLVLGGIAGVYLGRHFLDRPIVYYAIAAAMMGLLIAASAIFSHRATKIVIDLVIKLETRLGRKLASERIKELAAQFTTFGKQRGIIAASIAFTFIIRLIWVLSCWVVAHSLGLGLPFPILMAFIAIVDIARMAPIALPNGLGVREYLLVMLLAQINVPTTQAIIFSLIAYTLLMVNGLIGGILYTAQGAARSVD